MIIMIKIRDSQWKIMLCNNPSKGHFKVHLNERGRVGGEGGVHKAISNHFEVFFYGLRLSLNCYLNCYYLGKHAMPLNGTRV